MKPKNKRHAFRMISVLLLICFVCPFLMGMTIAAAENTEESTEAGEPAEVSDDERGENASAGEESESEDIEPPADTNEPETDAGEESSSEDEPPEETPAEEPEPNNTPAPESSGEPVVEPTPEDTEEEPEPTTPIYEYQITISGGDGWFNTPVVFQIYVEDLTAAGWAKVEAYQQENGEYADLTGMLREQGYAVYTVSKNGTLFVFVTDPDGNVHSDSFPLNCFDYDGPTVRAGIDNTLLHVEAIDLLSGVQGIIVNNSLYTTLENGILNLPISDNSTDTVFEIIAVDNLQNASEPVLISNPFFKESAETHDEHCPPDCDCRKSDGSQGGAGTQTPAPVTVQPAETQQPTATPTPAATATPAPTTVPVKSEESSAETPPISIEPGASFTTNGDAVTRDLLYDKYTNKQFIVVETRNGETFYLVIDYDKPLDEEGEHYETYFLNLVDEADLQALTGGSSTNVTDAPVCTCSDRCETGHINTACEVCRININECTGKQIIRTTPEPEAAATPEPETKPVNENAKRAVVLLVLLVLLAACAGTYCWLRLRKTPQKSKGSVDLDDYDYGEEDDNDDEYSAEPDDADTNE